MSGVPAFVRHQQAFTAHIRDPQGQPRPADVEERRMAVYRDLLYRNVEGFMASAFPVLRSLYDDGAWHALVGDYFRRHRAHTPLFPQMPREFLRYLEEERGPHPDDPPFLHELAHYEWVELALTIDPRDPDLREVDREGDLVAGVPVLSPLAWPLAYRFPVHRIGPSFRPETPPDETTYLVVYRDPDDEVRFMEANPVTARLLALLAQEPVPTGVQALGRIAQELAHPNPEKVLEGGKVVLEDLRRRGVLLGARRA